MSKPKRPMTRRDLTTLAFIVLAVTAAASVMLIGPMRNEAHRAKAGLEAARRASADAPTLLTQSVAWRQSEERIKRMQAQVAKHSTGAIDSAALTQRLHDVAGECGLALSRIQPSPERITAPMKPDGTPDAAPLAALRVSLDTTATYDAVVQFINALETEFGFVRIETLRLAPVSADGRPMVRTTIESVHFAFDPALADPPAPVAPGILGGTP